MGDGMEAKLCCVAFCPAAETPLGVFARGWAGRDLDTGEAVERPPIASFSEARLSHLVARFVRDGCRIDFKPLFWLAPDADFSQVQTFVGQIAADQQSFLVPPLNLRAAEGHVWLQLQDPSPGLAQLSAVLVKGLDGLRAQPTREEVRRLKRFGLSPRQLGNLVNWGHPDVLEDFQPRIRLAELPLARDRKVFFAALSQRVEPATRIATLVDGLTILTADAPEAPVRIVSRHPFAPLPE